MSDEYANREMAKSTQNMLDEEIDKIIDSLASKIKFQDEYYDIINYTS